LDLSADRFNVRIETGSMARANEFTNSVRAVSQTLVEQPPPVECTPKGAFVLLTAHINWMYRGKFGYYSKTLPYSLLPEIERTNP
jgi:hypothetical protein